jgi:hypothetical protein
MAMATIMTSRLSFGAARPNGAIARNYESGGQEFESLQARQVLSPTD